MQSEARYGAEIKAARTTQRAQSHIDSLAMLHLKIDTASKGIPPIFALVPCSSHRQGTTHLARSVLCSTQTPLLRCPYPALQYLFYARLVPTLSIVVEQQKKTKITQAGRLPKYSKNTRATSTATDNFEIGETSEIETVSVPEQQK